MKISSFHISKYKSITRPFILNEPGKLHFFIGSNNAGKTNILDAISQLYARDDARLYDAKAQIEVLFSLRSTYGKIFQAVQKGSQRTFRIDGKRITEERAIEVLRHHIVRLCATSPIDQQSFQKDYQTLQKKFPRAFRAFSLTLKEYVPKIALTAKFLTEQHVKEEKILRPFERLGAGFQQVFVILMYLFHPQYTILLLEEPEIHLHPALIKKLLRIIEEENLYNQIFLTTHSPLFIRTENLHRLFRVTKEQGNTRVYSPRLAGKRLNYNRLTQELNADNTEMFFADKVLLVEGSSDRLLMRGLIDRFYQGEKDIKVIQTYGKSNVDLYAELLELFNVPYAVLLDRDALFDAGIYLLNKKDVKRRHRFQSNLSLLNKLKRESIFILPNGSIEQNYPRKYQRKKKHKPQNALYAASRITSAEYCSGLMKHVREVIDSL